MTPTDNFANDYDAQLANDRAARTEILPETRISPRNMEGIQLCANALREIARETGVEAPIKEDVVNDALRMGLDQMAKKLTQACVSRLLGDLEAVARA